MISAAARLQVRHVRLTTCELAKGWEASGLTAEYAAILADMDTAIAKGDEDRVTNEGGCIAGREPNDFESFLDRHRDSFA